MAKGQKSRTKKTGSGNRHGKTRVRPALTPAETPASTHRSTFKLGVLRKVDKKFREYMNHEITDEEYKEWLRKMSRKHTGKATTA